MKKTIAYADFETTQPNENEEVRVYLWCIVLENGKKEFGTDISSFMNYIRSKKLKIYFHNARFDFSYIHYYLLKNDIKVEILEKLGILYSAKFWDVEIVDSMNFLPMTLKEVGLNYCSNYQKTQLEEYAVDYNHFPTKQEIEYCFNDCLTLKEGLENYFDTLIEVLQEAGAVETAKKVTKKLTNAGIAFSAFCELSSYEECCPKTTYNEFMQFKEAYKGGYVYSNPKGIVENIQMIDCNSMYPFMYSSIDMPIGKPIKLDKIEDFKNYKFYIIRVIGEFSLKKGYIPIIGGGISKYGGTLYKSVSDGLTELTLTKQDYELIQKFYNCNFTFVDGWGFETANSFFKKYADIFIAMKNRYKGIKRAVVKVLLNSPYGKMAMNGLQEKYTYSINADGLIDKELTGIELDENMYNYLPIAIAITAASRKYLLETANTIGFKNVMYMDTDSIKYKNKKVGLVFDSDKLGMWKDEGLVPLFKTIAPKKYCYYDGEKIHFKCAGVNGKSLEKFLLNEQNVTKEEAINLMNTFDRGFKISCLQSQLYKGGRYLKEVIKEIR